MSDSGLLSTGFKRKRLDQLLSELNAEMKAVFGDNLNLDPQSPDGQVNGVIAESQANLWEIAEAVHNAYNPSAATGASLSNLVQLNGITRKPATFSNAIINVTGTDGTIVTAGSLISTSDTKAQFVVDADITIAAGTGSGTATASVSGTVNAFAGTLTVIDTPITGWDTVTNPSDATIGDDEETDAELRIRRNKSFGSGSVAQIESLLAEILNIPTVLDAFIYENDTTAVDALGIPPHSFSAVVEGATDSEVAQAIFNKKPIGIGTDGNVTVNVLDSQNVPHAIKFRRPTLINIFIEVDITPLSDYPGDGDTQVKQAIVDFANGLLIEGKRYGVSDDVIYSELYIPINSVSGVQVNSLKVDTVTPPVATSNVVINEFEKADFDTTRITII